MCVCGLQSLWGPSVQLQLAHDTLRFEQGAGLAGAGVLGQALPLPRPVCSRPPAPQSQVREGRPWMAAGEQASRAQGLRSVSASCGLAAGQ